MALHLRLAGGPRAAFRPETPAAERPDDSQVALERRLRDTLDAKKLGLSVSSRCDAIHSLPHREGPSLDARSRALHRMLVNGVEIEHRDAEGSVCGEQVRVVDLDSGASNDWPASTRSPSPKTRAHAEQELFSSSAACRLASSN